MNRPEAEKHWLYTSELLKLAGHQPTGIEHFLYVEAMLHGAKHEKENYGDLEHRP